MRTIVNWIFAPLVVPIAMAIAAATRTPVEVFWETMGAYFRGEF